MPARISQRPQMSPGVLVPRHLRDLRFADDRALRQTFGRTVNWWFGLARSGAM